MTNAKKISEENKRLNEICSIIADACDELHIPWITIKGEPFSNKFEVRANNKAFRFEAKDEEEVRDFIDMIATMGVDADE